MPSLLCYFVKASDTGDLTNPWTDITFIEISFPGLSATCQITSAGEFTNTVRCNEYDPDVAITIPGQTINSFTCHFIDFFKSSSDDPLSMSFVGVFEDFGIATSSPFMLNTFVGSSPANYNISDTMANIAETFFTNSNNFTNNSGIYFGIQDTGSNNALCSLESLAVEFFYGGSTPFVPHYINSKYYKHRTN